jgi:hypothetical protein
MARTLKERYEAKRVQNLKERLKPIDRKITESIDNRDKLILEAFDKQQITGAIDIIKKLKAINFGALQSLASARDLAVGDVTKVIGGGGGGGILKKILSVFKNHDENPLVDALAFSSAMKHFFEQFSQFMTALDTNDNQTLGMAISGSDDPSKGQSQLQQVIVKGFKPDGALASAGKNWIDKYLKGKKGLQQLAKELVNVTIGDLNSISTSVVGGLKNADAVGQAAAGAAQQASVQSTSTTGAEQAKSTEPSAGTVETKPGTVAPEPQVVDQTKGGPDTDKAKQLTLDIHNAVGKKNHLAPAAISNIVDYLNKRGMLKV